MIRLVRAAAVCLLGGLLFAAGSPAALAAQPSADLILGDQTDQPDPAYAGDVITYIGGFGNAGPDAATDVRFQVTLPTSFRYEPSRSSSNCALAGSTVTCSYATWPANGASAPDDPTIAVTALAPGTYDLVFTISANERDRNTANNTRTETTTVVQPVDADLVLHLSDYETREGEFFYAVAVSNEGPADATNVVATLELPAGIEYVSGGCTTSGQTLTCPFGDIPAGRGLGAIQQFRATQSGTFTISGTVAGAEPDPNTANNADSGTIVVRPADADLSVDVPDSTTTRVGESFAFPITVTNAGPADATNVLATLDLPDGVGYVGGDCSASGQRVTCSFAGVTAGSIATATPLLRATAAGTYSIAASVDGDQPDGVASNNSDSGLVTVDPVADVAVSVAESMDPVKPGQGVTYTATVTNAGPSTATGVTLSLAWASTSPRGIAVESSGASQGTCVQTDSRLDCQIGSLAPGESATVTLSLKPRGKGTLTVTADAAAAEFDANSANNSATEATTVGPG